jgi:hypothetical protein
LPILIQKREEKPEKHFEILLNGKLVFLLPYSHTHTHAFAKNRCCKNWIGGVFAYTQKGERYRLNEGNSFLLELYISHLQANFSSMPNVKAAKRKTL